MIRPSPIAPGFRPGHHAVRPGAPASSPERKSPPLEALYPEKDAYLRLPPERYTSRTFMQQEWDAIWSRTWTCAGLVSDLVRPGDFVRYDLGHESIVVVRGRDGALRAFYNVCRHRGRQLVAKACGSGSSFVCSFHGWIYDVDGRNRRVTDRELFDPRTLEGGVDLRPVRCETWGPFVFVALDPDAPPLLEHLAPMPELFEAYALDELKLVKDVAVAVDCNWKVASEAFLEPYHTHATHPQIVDSIDELHNQYDYYPRGHSRVISPLSIPSPRLADRTTLTPAMKQILAVAGVDPERFQGTALDVRDALRAAKRRADNPFGVDYRCFSDDQLVDNWNPSIFPNLAMNALPEAVQVMRFLPDAVDPGRSTFHVWTLVRATRPGIRPTPFFGVEPDADLTGATRPPRRRTTEAAPELGEVLEQDVANMSLVQRGLASAGCDVIRLSEQEGRIQQLHAEIDRRIAARQAA
ncbi:MAG: aromatic ring-hydroxylating dioxygenase subunit alpha [Deltaproteobacteria bacterium]|nr:aromatic ring-hydroxylating dioxygenase subunit alpha [Deltaproteobacteria bacterium]